MQFMRVRLVFEQGTEKGFTFLTPFLKWPQKPNPAVPARASTSVATYKYDPVHPSIQSVIRHFYGHSEGGLNYKSLGSHPQQYNPPVPLESNSLHKTIPHIIVQECYLSVCFALCGGDERSEMEISKLRDNQSKLQFSGLNYSDWTGRPRRRRRRRTIVITAGHNCKGEKPPKNNSGNIQLTEALKRWWWWFDFTSILGLAWPGLAREVEMDISGRS